MGTDNALTVRRLFQDVWNGDHPATADDLVHGEYLIHDRDFAADLQGPELYKELAAGTREAFPDAAFVIDDIFQAGDRVAVRWTMTGTHEGAAFGVEPTGMDVTMEGIEIDRFLDGRMIETWIQTDEVAVMEQLQQVGGGSTDS